MITSSVIITSIICFTILCISIIIGHYSNKDKNSQKLADIRLILFNFKRNYINQNDNYKFNGNNTDIINLIDSIRDIVY